MAARKKEDFFGIEAIVADLRETMKAQQSQRKLLEADESDDGVKKYDRITRRYFDNVDMYRTLMVKYAVIRDAEHSETSSRSSKTRKQKLTPMQEIWKKEGKL